MQLALAAGDSVTALVRSADSLSDMSHERLTIEVGNVRDPAFLTSILPGHDAVVSTVGPRSPTKSACTIYTDAANAIVEAMEATGLRRVLVTSTALLFPPTKLMDRFIRVIAKNNFRAAGEMEARIRGADLDWTFARSGFLNDDEATTYLKAEGSMPEAFGSISRSALATFLFDALKTNEHIGKVVGLSKTN